MGRAVNRGEVWLAEVGRKRRPVLVLTRGEVLDVRTLVTITKISTSARGLAAEVEIDHTAVGLDRPSIINCNNLHTVAQSTLTTRVGIVDKNTMHDVCITLNYALGC